MYYPGTHTHTHTQTRTHSHPPARTLLAGSYITEGGGGEESGNEGRICECG